MSNASITPDLNELIALRAVVAGRRLPKRGQFGVHGQGLSNVRGRGMEYAESREYIVGDDARYIDWKLTARSGRPHTKLFQAERERLTLILCDTPKQIYFGTQVRFKSVQAARAAAIACWLANRDGDRLSAIRASKEEVFQRPATGINHTLHTIDAIARWYQSAPADDLGLGHSLSQAERIIRPGTRLIVFSDISSLEHVELSQWQRLSRQHTEVILVVLYDVLETTPPHYRLPFENALGKKVELDFTSDKQRQLWARHFSEPLHQALHQLPSYGIKIHALSTSDKSDDWLMLTSRQGRAA